MINFPVGHRRVQFSVVHPDNWESDSRSVTFEPEVVNIISKVVRPGDFVIDAGANFGFYSLVMSQLVGQSGMVMAFEPDPRIYGQLVVNVEANKFDNIVYSDMALWNEDCDKEFWLHPLSGYSSFGAYDESEMHMVKARKIDTLCQAFSPPRFMKVDCEGSELWIMYGAEQTLRRGVEYIVAELNYELLDQFHLGKTWLREYMAKLGYHMFVINIKEDGEYKLHRLEADQFLTINCRDPDAARMINVLFSMYPDPLATERICHG